MSVDWRFPAHCHRLDTSLFRPCLCSSCGFGARPPVRGRHRPLPPGGALESVSTRGALLNVGTERAGTVLAPAKEVHTGLRVALFQVLQTTGLKLKLAKPLKPGVVVCVAMAGKRHTMLPEAVCGITYSQASVCSRVSCVTVPTV